MEIGELQVPADYTYNKALRWMGVDGMHLSPGEDGELQVPAGYNIRLLGGWVSYIITCWDL